MNHRIEESENRDAEAVSGEAVGVGADRNKNPILLFDGVCNLCDASVQFVIDRDPQAQFRFAALQSEAARQELERVGAPDDLPDSVVLIDEAGFHTRSDAAIRTARRLGLPWSLLAAGGVVPRPLRDVIYGWIARHRYRWFGRQTACRIPTPELRARFLDAAEPATVVPSESVEPSTDRPRGLGLGTLPGRFLLLYPILFMLPFPLTLLGLLSMIPGLGESFVSTAFQFLIGLHGQVVDPIVAALGMALTGEEVSFEFTGSGDGLAAYLDVLVDLVAASLLAVGWWAWRRSEPIAPKIVDLSRVLIRYFLAWILLSYGFSKIFPVQFPAPGPDRLLQPYGDSSPMGLLWTFMGASAGYQMFGGAAELLGGLLLLFRRTTLLGALVAAGVLTNVFALNLFYDVPVKLYSLHYLFFASLLALPDVPRLFGFFVANIPVAPSDRRAAWAESPRLRRVFGFLKIGLIVALLGTNIHSRIVRMNTSGLWAPEHPLRGIYRVETFDLGESGDPGVQDEARWVRVGLRPPYVGTVQRADGLAVRMRLQVDMDASTLALYDRSLTEPDGAPLRFEQLGDGLLRLEGDFEGRRLDVTLSREEHKSLLTSRGFQWISEYPYNR